MAPGPPVPGSAAARRSATLAQGAPAHPQQRHGALAERLGANGALSVEGLGRGADGFAEGAVVGLPPEVAGQPGLPGVHLDVHALVEAEFGVRAADARVLDSAPGALTGA